jgi:hypothetical protein
LTSGAMPSMKEMVRLIMLLKGARRRGLQAGSCERGRQLVDKVQYTHV